MKSNAAGQFLGYSIQFPRALCRLLQSGPGGAVGVEVLGDVASFSSDGNILAEEDKSSLSGNPLTDRSIDLWKTFYNWISAILDNELDLEKTRFVLYCNKTGRCALVNEFHAALSPQDAAGVVAHVKEELIDIVDGHSIWMHFDFVINKHGDVFAEIIRRFELQIGKDAGFDDVRYELSRLSIHEGLIDHVMHSVLGWLQTEILEKITKGEASIISWEKYNHHHLVLYERIRQQELIDFSSHQLPSDEEVSGYIKVRPTYIRQLELIELHEGEIIGAVSDYLRADFNRNKWIEIEIFDEETAAGFEEKLKSFWSITRRKIERVDRGLKEEERGQALLEDCQIRQETIRGIAPPYSTIQGTYHALADGRGVGWHPRWEELIDEKGGADGSNR